MEDKELFQQVKSSLEHIFEVIYEWSVHEANVSRKVWLNLTGVPLHAWCEESFLLLGDLWGTSIFVDHCTINKECLEFGRVLVLTQHMTMINQKCELKVGNIIYPVFCYEGNIGRVDHNGFSPMSSPPYGGSQERELEELGSSSFVADSILATQGPNLQPLQSMIPIEKPIFKETLQDIAVSPRLESVEAPVISPLLKDQNTTRTEVVLPLVGKSPVKAKKRSVVQSNTRSNLKDKSVKEKYSAKVKSKKYKRKLDTDGGIMPSSTQASVSSSDIRHRNAVLRRQAEQTIESGKLMGINYGDMEEDTIQNIMASYRAEQHS
ncbi:hypothetical protein U1Q18_052709 [Sarracenia purpurea var. burkii]